jgi:hypothetical protein
MVLILLLLVFVDLVEVESDDEYSMEYGLFAVDDVFICRLCCSILLFRDENADVVVVVELFRSGVGG